MLKNTQYKKLYFIAEIGQNHQGSLQIAKQMVDSLVGSGVSAIKTAKRDIETCLTEDQKKMPYLNQNSFGKTYYEHRKALELSHDDFKELKEYSESKGFDFISSFTDKNSFDFLNCLGLDKIKIASSRVVDFELLYHVSRNYDKTIFMSSGMSNIGNITEMIDIFKENEKYLMQCSSIYPCPDHLINLNVFWEYRQLFLNEVDGFGFSGHHSGIIQDVIAYMMFDVNIIERHYTLNRAWKGTDHAGSLGIDGINKIIKYINQSVESLGSYTKDILPEEQKAIEKLRGDLL